MAVADQLGGEIVHPVGIRLTEAGPFVGGALGVACEVDELIVDVDAAGSGAAFEFGLAEAGGGFGDVDDFAADGEDGVNVVEIGVVGGPRRCASVDFAGGVEDGLFRRRPCRWFRRRISRGDPRRRLQRRRKVSPAAWSPDSLATCDSTVMVARLAGDVKFRRVDVNAGGFQALVQRQRLVDAAHDVEPDVVVDAAVVGVEIFGFPFEAGVGGDFST